jgi:hypothetical protein
LNEQPKRAGEKDGIYEDAEAQDAEDGVERGR